MFTKTHSIEAMEARRFLSAGQLRAGFGVDGRVFDPLTAGAEARDVLAQPDGKLLLAEADVNGHGYVVKRLLNNGSLDPSFGDEGIVQLSFGDFAPRFTNRIERLALQNDNKILVAGESGGGFSVARLKPDGSLDSTFGVNGQQIVRWTNAPAALNAIQMTPDGRIILAGSFAANVGLARLTPAGALDVNFGEGGKIRQNLPGSSEVINTVAIQADGSVLAGGSTADTHGNPQMFLERFSAAGKLDSTFGANGIVTPRLGTGPSTINAVRIAPDREILIGAMTEPDAYASSNQAFILKLKTNGAIDKRFAGTGYVAVPPSPDYSYSLPIGDFLTDMQVAANGRIYFAGSNVVVRISAAGVVDTEFGDGDAKKPGTHLSVYQTFDIAALRVLSNGQVIVAGEATPQVGPKVSAVVRLTSDGQLDPNFGAGGKVSVDLAAQAGQYNDVVSLPDGRFYAIATGEALASGTFDFLIERRRADGSLDPTFGDGGRGTIDFGGQNDSALAVALQPDGKIVVVGQTAIHTENSDVIDAPVMARLSAKGVLDHSFGVGGRVRLSADVFREIAASAVTVLSDGRIVIGTKTFKRATASLVAFRADGTMDVSIGRNGQLALGGDCNQLMALPGDQFLALSGQRVLSRYDSDGTLDKHFGVNGRLILPGTSSAFARTADGHLVIAGSMQIGQSSRAAFLSFTSSGRPDKTFAKRGVAIVSDDDSFLDDLIIQPDGKLVATNSSLLIRANADGSMDSSFGEKGIVQNAFAETLHELFHVTQLADGTLVEAAAAAQRVPDPQNPWGGTAPAMIGVTSSNAEPPVQIAAVSHTGTLIVASSPLPDAITIADKGSRVAVTWNGQTQLFNSVKRIWVDGGDSPDQITNTSVKPATLHGGAGFDEIYGGPGNEYIDGGAGNDVLSGDEMGVDIVSSSNDTILGGDGNDYITGGNGDDSLDGGSGNDSLFGNAEGFITPLPPSRDTLIGGDGFDSLVGPFGGDATMDGGAGDDSLEDHGMLANSALITGGEGNDIMQTQSGHAVLDGGAGNDRLGAFYTGDKSAVTLIGGAGDDTLEGSPSADFLSGGAGNDSIEGDDGNDTLDGGPGADSLFGNGGNDIIYAADHQRDTIDGGAGFDKATRDDSAIKGLVSKVESFI